MNIRINKHTKLENWKRKTIFSEFPIHIKAGNLVVTLLFHDLESLKKMRDTLDNTIYEINPNETLLGPIHHTFDEQINHDGDEYPPF